MKILVFGGSGFVGKVLVKNLLLKGYHVIVIDKKIFKFDDCIKNNKYFTFIKKDLTTENLDDITFSGVDIIIDLIGRQYVDTKVPYFNRQKFFDEVNVGVTEKILQLAVLLKVKKFFYLSTDMVYGIPKKIPISELHPCDPVGPYGMSKLKSEHLIQNYLLFYDIPYIILRPRFIIGPGRGGVLESLLKLFMYNLPVPLFGNGKNHYQMIHVNDLVNFILLCLSSKKEIKGIFNVGSIITFSFLEMYSLIKEKTYSRSIIFPTYHSFNKLMFSILDGIGMPLLYKDQYEIADQHYILDISKAQSIGWQPYYSDKESVLEFLDNYLLKKNYDISKRYK